MPAGSSREPKEGTHAAAPTMFSAPDLRRTNAMAGVQGERKQSKWAPASACSVGGGRHPATPGARVVGPHGRLEATAGLERDQEAEEQRARLHRRRLPAVVARASLDWRWPQHIRGFMIPVRGSPAAMVPSRSSLRVATAREPVLLRSAADRPRPADVEPVFRPPDPQLALRAADPALGTGRVRAADSADYRDEAPCRLRLSDPQAEEAERLRPEGVRVC